MNTMDAENDFSLSDFERIESYLTGRLTAEEQIIFERAIAANTELADEVAVHRELIKAVEIEGLRKAFDDLHDRVIVPVSENNTRRWFAIAAGIALLIACGVWLQFQPNEFGKLYAQNATIDPGMPVPMSATAVNLYVFYDAMVDYKAEKYDLAIEKWSALIVENPDSDTLNFYLGAAYFADKAYFPALPYLKKAALDFNSKFRYKGQWYETLTLLKLEDREAILSITPYDDSPYRAQILDIQNQLGEE